MAGLRGDSRAEDTGVVRRRVLGWLLAVYGAGAVVVLLFPVGLLLGRLVHGLYRLGLRIGMPASLGPRWYEFGLNVVLFAVPTVLAVLLWPHVRRWVWLGLAVGISLVVELIQGLWLPRTRDVVDVIANVLGAVVGLVAVTVLGHQAPVAERRPTHH